MKGVGPGTMLGGRYTVHDRLEQVRDTERWAADDSTLGRRVSILAMDSSDPRTPGLLDAARRAASVSHSVFVRILDVGTDADVAYVVEEDLGDARTLGALVADGGIPGDEVRRITGEVAAALESARQRGMHHLDLTPDDVLRTPEGEVRLRGLETAAVRAGEEAADAEDAARRDAVGVVALAYAGLTGLWPLGAGGAGLAPAPRVASGLASPSEVAAGVPRDLDALCRLTLNDDQGPTSPGDYARQVAPWPARQVIGRPVVPMPAGATTTPSPEDPSANDPTTFDARPTPEPAEQVAAPTAAPTPEVSPVHEREEPVHEREEPVHEEAGTGRRSGLAALAGLGAAGAGAAAARSVGATSRETDHGVTPWPSEPDPPPTRVLRRDPGPEWLSAPEPAGPASARGDLGADAPTGHTGPVPTDRPSGTNGYVRPTLDDEPSADEAAGESRGERLGAAAAGAGAAVAGALGTAGARVSALARRAVDKVSETLPDTERAAPAPGEDLEAPAPMVPAEPLTRDESKLALGIVAVFVILALVVGIYGVSRIGQGSANLFAPAGPPVTRTTTVAPSATGSADAAGAPEPLAILKVEAYDPQGDNYEHNELVGKTYDGNPDTGWYSESYSNQQFGGLKSGVGLIVDLGPNKQPKQVILTIPNKSAVQVWIGPDARLEGATMIGEKDPAQGQVTFDVPSNVDGQYIILWYPKVYPDSKGGLRAWLNEVVVTG